MIVASMVLVPVFIGIICLFISDVRWLSRFSVLGAVVSLIVALYCCVPLLTGTALNESIWYIDGLSGFFLTITAVISFVALIYSKDYMSGEYEEGVLSAKDLRNYYFFMFIFISAILFTFAVRSAALTWIGIGATTLISAFLVGMYKDRRSTEAAWKYIMLCSVGITLALFGIALLFAASTNVIPDESSLDWPALVENALDLNPVLMKFAAAFFIIGLGIKAGFAPLHNWLPDAHGQAPSPVSAMMSGVLLNCAMYGIMRFYSLSEVVNPEFARNILLFFGIISLVVSSAFILISKDLKKMLAYSSIENMGLIAIGLGIGTPMALFAAMFIVLAHSICKPLIFFCAGDLIQAYDTRIMSDIRGVSKKMRFSGLATTAGGLAIAGAPPFPLFIGELLLIAGALGAGMYAVAAFLAIMLIIVFAGLIMHIAPMLSGSTDKDVKDIRSPLRMASVVILIAIAVFFGLFMPDQLKGIIDGIVLILSGGA